MSKTITAVFGNGIFTTTAKVFQWDAGDKLQFVGIDLPENYKVDFSNSLIGTSKSVLGDSTGVVIPPEFFHPGRMIYAWVVIPDNDGRYTKYQVNIPIYARAEPTDEEPTPEQQSALDQAINELNDAQDALEEAASHIIESGITPEERAKLAGIEAGAEVNVIEEVRYFDVLRQEYRPLPVTNKGVNLPRNEIIPENDNDVVYFDFGIDAEGNVTQYEFPGPMIDAVNRHGQTVIARVKLANDSCYYLLPLTHMDGYEIRFTGFTGEAEKLEIVWATNLHKWYAKSVSLVDWDSADNSYVWANQGSENSGKVLTVGSDGNVAPQDAAAKAASIPMGHLDSTSTATVMTATVPGITELRDGVCVWLRNGVITSASGVTLNINSLGAKPIYNSLSGAIVTTTFTAASTYLFVYNSTRVTGGCWDMVYGYDTNTTYSPAKMGFGYATCSTAEATAEKTASLPSYTPTTGGYVTVKFTNAVPAGATLNINSKGAKRIYHKDKAITAGVIKAGDIVTFCYSTYYHIVAIISAQDESALPAVSSSDNGKVLMVVDGAWAAGSSPGTEQTISTAGAVTQALNPNVMYHFTGALTALTITLNAPASGQLAQYHFDFNCGSTAPTVTIPATVTMPDGNSFDANKHYEVDILNSYGVVAAWANS